MGRLSPISFGSSPLSFVCPPENPEITEIPPAEKEPPPDELQETKMIENPIAVKMFNFTNPPKLRLFLFYD